MGLLDSVIGSVTGSSSGGSSATSPLVKALMLLVAAKAASSYMGGSSASTAAPKPPAQPGAGESGTITSGVLKGLPSLDSLLDRFRQSGHADKVESWVGSGQNQAIQPHELQNALGPQDLDHLEKETGLPRDQLLSQLSKVLPQFVDKLTPNGRLPTPQETAHW